MKNKHLYSLLTISVIFVFIMSLFSTVNVLADDSTPPAPIEEPVVDVTPTDVPPTEDPTATEILAEDVSVPEALVQLPDGTDVIVSDQNGEALTLASTDAADVLATADPYFWDGTQYVGYSASGLCPLIVVVCNTNSSPIQAAVDAFEASGTASGYIYVEAAGSPYAENVVVDGTYNTGYLANLNGIIGEGSGSTTNNGSFEIHHMNAFTLEGFTVNGNVQAHDNIGTLTLNDLIVTNTTGTGIIVADHDGDINLTNVNSSNNLYNGAYLANDTGSGTGDVSVTNSNFDSNTSSGEDVGLYIDSNGSVTLSGVSASDNLAGDGSDIYDFSSLSIENSFFNGNESSSNDYGYGLFIGSGTGNVSLTNVEASGNSITPNFFTSAGAYIDTFGTVKVTDSSFSNNETDCGCGADGLDIYNANTVTLVNVTANENTWDGVYTYNVDTVSVTGGYFNNNGNLFGSGLDLDIPLVVTLRNIQANGNVGSGAYIGSASPMDISIICSQFSGNSEYGLEVEGDGQVVLDRVTFFDNGLGDYFIDNATVSIFSNGNCDPEKQTKKKIVDGSSLPLKIVNVTGGQSVELDCEHFGGTKLLLENGNSITLPCPINDSASIVDANKIEDLPKPLPEGNTFLSAFTTSVSKKGEKLGKLGSFATISFMIPEGVEASKLAILFWNGTEWTDVKNTYVRNDPVTGDSYFEAFVNETGTFVLVQK
ncbi:MAG TPA: right-handed parallel beta-helix repeat-containing protein [Anaerolineales bacterium]|nr:right-handed parallel beta-helix repeat-containing protein [Anaerolineales bacterium]